MGVYKNGLRHLTRVRTSVTRTVVWLVRESGMGGASNQAKGKIGT
jgi:hypothetical protein